MTVNQADQMPRTYADHVVPYAQAGWPCILPVPAAAKFPPPGGFTGADGRDTDPLTLVEFATMCPAHSIALRMPDGVIGIDIDEYDKVTVDAEGNQKVVQKRGCTTLSAAIERWGPLPATWSSTARGDDTGPGVSRILFFRVPPRRYAPQLGTDVEVIQRHHRYVVVAPSPNPHAGGASYRWYWPNGEPAAPGEIPSPADMAELPAAWVAGLSEGATEQGPAASDPAAGHQLLNQLRADTRIECAEITSVRLTALDELTAAEAGSRHDALSKRVYQLVQIAAHGHTGASYAIEALRDAWASATAGEAREREFFDMLTTAARKAVTLVGDHQVPRDPCLFIDGFEVPGAVPEGMVDENDQPVAPIEPPRWLLPREIIGTHSFDPPANLDQPLAQAVLERTYPLLRYAYDSHGWLLRGFDRWELHKDLTNRAVTLVAGLLPIGDPTAEKGSDEEERSKRRGRFNSNAGRTAIAKTAQALVDGGMHPCTVKLAELDSDPEILWAGGLPWNLRACRLDAAMQTWLARVDAATPHLQTAAVLPELRETPLWDAFLEAVWPDPGVRAWALRVLAVTFTGRSDRALPILLGDQGRGKTQVINLLMSVLGSYAHAADRRLLNSNGERAHQSIVFALKGRRLSFIDEGTKGGQFAEAQLKLLTGGGDLTGNQMGQNPITFAPTHTLVLTANDEPVLTDPAIKARVRLIPCDGDPEHVRATRAAIGSLNGAAWRAEAPAVLARMMTEAAAWLEDPTSGSTAAAPEAVRELADRLAVEQDPVRTWLRDDTEPWPAGTSSRELYSAFVAGCLQANMRRDEIPSETAWGKALTRHGFDSIHTRQGKVRMLRIRPHDFWGAIADGSAPAVTGCDGLVTGSTPNPSPEFSQVSPSVSVDGDGLTGSVGSTHMRTHTGAHAHETTANQPSTRHTRHSEPTEETLFEAPKPAKKQQTEAARTKAAEAKAAKRQAAVDETAGPAYDLPAVVLRDGSITELSAAQASDFLATLAGQPLTIDVENTGYPVGHRLYALRTVQLGNEAFAVVLDPIEHAEVIRPAVVSAPMLHAHSATADLVPLEVAGLLERGIDEAWSRMFDTVIPAKLADPASTGSDPSLKKLAPAVLGADAVSPAADQARSALFKAGGWLMETKVDTPFERSGWAQVNSGSATMLRYGASDVLDDAALAARLPWPDAGILERERLAQRMTGRVAHVGLQLDGEQVERLYAEQLADRASAAERLAAFGVDSPGSDQQVAAAVERLGLELPRTKTGRPSVAAGVLEPYAKAEGALGDLIRARLDYQTAKNRIGLFLEGYRQAVVNGDGRVRPTVYTMEAKTGRMSCVRPNLQQVPREGGFRACITADPGHVLISADFASVELRVAAALSQDPALRAILEDPERDIHMEIARLVWGPQATKAERYMAKRKVFGRIYGSGINGLVTADPPVSESTAKAIVHAMDQMTPGLTEWSRMVANSVEAGHTQFRTHSGRIVHMPKDRAYAAPNYCIQGTARELLIDALVLWNQTRWGNAVLLPVHDELLVQVPEDEADAATAALTEAMASQLHGIQIVAEASEPSFEWKDSA